MRSKQTVYVVATLTAMLLFLPFQDHAWALYLGVCAGYTVLVFGLRRIPSKQHPSAAVGALPVSKILLVHATFLLIVTGWVWVLLALRPKLPYILRTEDSSRPYFGLVFLGVLGLLGVEYFEQRQLGAETKSGLPDPVSSQVKK